MPLYDVRCEICGRDQEIYRSLADFDDLPECCGVQMKRLVCAPMVMSDIQPYQSMIDGSMITSRAQHKQHLKDHGCIEIGNETDHQIRNAKPKSDWDKGLKKELAERLDNHRS